MFVSWHNKFDCKFTRDYAERCQILSKQVHSQYFSIYKFISMEVVAFDHFNKLKPFTIPMAQFHYRWSDESDQDTNATATHLHILLWFILTK